MKLIWCNECKNLTGYYKTTMRGVLCMTCGLNLKDSNGQERKLSFPTVYTLMDEVEYVGQQMQQAERRT